MTEFDAVVEKLARQVANPPLMPSRDGHRHVVTLSQEDAIVLLVGLGRLERKAKEVG